MDGPQTTVLVLASAGIVGGAILIVRRELTAPGRRKVGPVRDVVEVLAPIAGLLLLLIAAWAGR